MFNIVIIGGNLAGASAAINASIKVKNVALVERHEEPIFPAHCGEGLADVTADFLELDKIGCYKNQINNVEIDVSKMKKYTFKLRKHKMYIFDRNFLEKKLLKKAEKNGVELFTGISMRGFNPPNEIVLDNDMIKGKLIIDASGIACQVGRRMGIKTRLQPEDVGVCIQSRVESNFKADTIKMWYHKPYAPFGYAWLFPVNKNMANIGLGIPGGQKLDLSKLLNEYISYIVNSNYNIVNTFRSCVPSSLPLQNLTKDNVMFVGDAARLADAALGGGIQNAIFSGSLAGTIAADYIKGKISSLNVYQKAMEYKTDRLRKAYYRKSKLTTDEKFIKAYKRAFLMLSFLDRASPNLLENRVAKIMKKDISIFEQFQ